MIDYYEYRTCYYLNYLYRNIWNYVLFYIGITYCFILKLPTVFANAYWLGTVSKFALARSLAWMECYSMSWRFFQVAACALSLFGLFMVVHLLSIAIWAKGASSIRDQTLCHPPQ